MAESLRRSRGSEHHRWNNGRITSSHGYVKVRVGCDHPLADPNGYTYEHLLVWVGAGNARPSSGEVLHHVNGNKADNRLANLEKISRRTHAAEHHRMLPDEAVRQIRERFASGENGASLAKEFGIPSSRVYRFVKGETRLDAGGPVSAGSLRSKRAGRILDGREWSEVPRG